MKEIEKKNFKSEIITFVMLLFAFLGPTAICVSEYPKGEFTTLLMGIIWMIRIGSSDPNRGGSSPMPNAFILLHPVFILRLLFVYFLYRFYQEKTTRLSILVTGFIAELVPILMNLSSIFSSTQLYIPLTILFPVGLILVFIFPPAKQSDPWGTDVEAKDWFRGFHRIF